MPRQKRAVLVGLLFGLPACSVLAPDGTTPPVSYAPAVERPAQFWINDVEGVPQSWCLGRLGCADVGQPSPEELPVISLPFELTPPVGANLTAQEAILSGRDAERIDLLADGVVNVRDVPEGARMLSVTVHWGADDIWATYYWALDEPAESREPSPSDE